MLPTGPPDDADYGDSPKLTFLGIGPISPTSQLFKGVCLNRSQGSVHMSLVPGCEASQQPLNVSMHPPGGGRAVLRRSLIVLLPQPRPAPKGKYKYIFATPSRPPPE